MICPRCAVGDISDQTHECTLCGFSPAGVATLADPFPRELEASARKDLEQEFQIEGVLGQGPRGVVYLALERERDRLVALKIIPRTSGMAPEADALLRRQNYRGWLAARSFRSKRRAGKNGDALRRLCRPRF